MAIIVNLDVMHAKRKMKSKELPIVIGITEANFSILKSGKSKGNSFLYSRSYMQGFGMSTCRYFGVCGVSQN